MIIKTIKMKRLSKNISAILFSITLFNQSSYSTSIPVKTFDGAWSPKVTYSQGAIVTYNNQLFLTLTSNKNKIPEVNKTTWQLIATIGNSLLNGSSSPTSVIGNMGDYYIDNTEKMLYGPKSVLGWQKGTALVGQPGLKGAQGIQGVQGVQGVKGTPGATGLSSGYKLIDANKNVIGDYDITTNKAILDINGNTFIIGNGLNTSVSAALGADGFHDTKLVPYYSTDDCSGTKYYNVQSNPGINVGSPFSNIYDTERNDFNQVIISSNKLYTYDSSAPVIYATVGTMRSPFMSGCIPFRTETPQNLIASDSLIYIYDLSIFTPPFSVIKKSEKNR